MRAVGAPLGGVATIVRVAVEVETPSKTVSVTAKVPALNVCVTCAPSAAGLPSPKSQVIVSGSSSGCTDVSRKATCSGGAPLAGVALKLATGGVSVVCATASASLAISSKAGAWSRSSAAASRSSCWTGTSTATASESSAASSP